MRDDDSNKSVYAKASVMKVLSSEEDASAGVSLPRGIVCRIHPWNHPFPAPSINAGSSPQSKHKLSISGPMKKHPSRQLPRGVLL